MKANVLTLPAEFTAAYTDTDRELVAEVMAWLNRDDAHTHAELARLSRLPASTISSVLAGKHAADGAGRQPRQAGEFGVRVRVVSIQPGHDFGDQLAIGVGVGGGEFRRQGEDVGFHRYTPGLLR